jgi:hypothetical protein
MTAELLPINIVPAAHDMTDVVGDSLQSTSP